MPRAQNLADPINDPTRNQDPNTSGDPNSQPASRMNPSSPLPEPPEATVTPNIPATTLKRPREDDTEADADEGASTDTPSAKRRVVASQDLIYRIVVPSRQIGKVIGRGGHRIQKVREDTKATIKIADAISRHEVRVIIVSSKDSESVFSDAENALHQIVSLILKEDCGGNVETMKVGAGHVAANTVRLLIAGSQAGGLIGVSGQNIENLRNSSGANITVLSPSQLPPYASAHESDRVVQISGEIPVVLRAVVEIGCQLRENPPKQVISISPTYNSGFHRQPQQYLDPASAEFVNLDLLVPENLVGGLIGRFGANISRIRNESGANIKVHGGRGEQTQRQIHLGGSAQQVALAKQRVDEYVYAELMRQSGGQLQQTAVQSQQLPIQQPITHQPGMLSSLSTLYAPPTTGQAPYYGHHPYNAPPL
ncbi:poly(rC)-binding protein 4-like [Dorcoceras hygrometricum]|uniref:Poly(RC)-binding protein 4-like n=1 Tax=Dorcoceras hygrometricum TaxID=472368 RepID=A0A2Z7CFU4_9LAMI|nr:poly(rC)-binding protein 4-like [Dorcoceras hygrometricum]